MTPRGYGTGRRDVFSVVTLHIDLRAIPRVALDCVRACQYVYCYTKWNTMRKRNASETASSSVLAPRSLEIVRVCSPKTNEKTEGCEQSILYGRCKAQKPDQSCAYLRHHRKLLQDANIPYRCMLTENVAYMQCNMRTSGKSSTHLFSLLDLPAGDDDNLLFFLERHHFCHTVGLKQKTL